MKDKIFELKKIGVSFHKKEFLDSNEIIISLKIIYIFITIVFYCGIKIYVINLIKLKKRLG